MFIKVILGITYGVLTDILEEVEKECPDSRDIAHQLLSKIQLLNPDIAIGRESHFYETVKRIAAPMRPSIRGDSKLKGSLAQRYRDKVWIPRVQNNPQLGKFIDCSRNDQDLLFFYTCSFFPEISK